MRKTLYSIIILLALCSCSETKHLAEGEVLYRGIAEIAYGHKAKVVQKEQEQSVEQEGVISAVGKAVKNVSDLLSGNRDVINKLQDMALEVKSNQLTSAQRDSLKREMTVIKTALDNARTETDAAFACAPNGSLFGSSKIRSPFPFGLYFYNAFYDSKTMVGKWFLNTFGREPVTISSVNPATRIKVAQNILCNYGFFNSMAEYDILPCKDSLKAKIAYSVYPGPLFRLDSIEYRGFGEETIGRIIQKSRKGSLMKRGDAFSVDVLEAERERLSSALRDSGYYYFKPDYITFRADTIQRHGYVQMRIMPVADIPTRATRRYVLGNTDITLFRYDDYNVVDSIRIGYGDRRRDSSRLAKRKISRRTPMRRGQLPLTFRYSGKKRKSPLSLSELRRHLFYQKGMPYNVRFMDFQATNLQQMGIFSQCNLTYRERLDTLRADNQTPDTLDVIITAMLDKPYDSELGVGLHGKSNGQIGPSLSYRISKKNAFRRGETLSMGVGGSYEWQTGAQPSGVRKSALNSFELNGNISLSYPRLLMPGWRRIGYRARTSTDIAGEVSWLNRSSYYRMAKFKAGITYKYQRRRTLSHQFTPLSIAYTSMLKTSDILRERMLQNPSLAVSMRDQLVPAMEYTLSYTSRRDDPNPANCRFSVKESGSVINGLYSVFTRERWTDRDKTILGVPFANFIKAELNYSQTLQVSANSQFVFHGSTGILYTMGNSTSAPYNDLFAVGGANSIRAFCLRGIGPGSFNPANGGYSYLDQVGNLKLELNAEYRFNIVGNLNGALFLDAGNVWLIDEDPTRPGGKFEISNLGNEIGVGTGAGLRYDMSFLVVRFDLGIGLHAPYETGKSGWYNMPRFKDSLGYHFAIGYPF